MLPFDVDAGALKLRESLSTSVARTVPVTNPVEEFGGSTVAVTPDGWELAGAMVTFTLVLE
jgi:hypothetical protein